MADRPDGCVFRTLTALGSSATIGALLGAITVTWTDVPKVLKGKALPALLATGRAMGASSITFAAIGGLFAAVDCVAENLRGKKDVWNGAWGGAAAGSVVGLRAASLPLGVGAAAALAATSVLVDTTGGTLRGDGVFEDGATQPRKYFPYGMQAAGKAE